MQFFSRSVSLFILVIFVTTPFLVGAQAKSAATAKKVCNNKAFQKALTKKDAKSIEQAERLLKKLLPMVSFSQVLSQYTQELKNIKSKKLTKKSKANACVSAVVNKKKKVVNKKKKVVNKKKKDAGQDAKPKDDDVVTRLLQELEKEAITVGANESLYTSDEETAKGEHGFTIGLFGGPAWQQLVKLAILERIAIAITMNCGFFRQGDKKIGNTIQLSKEILMWFYLYNQAKGIMGCPAASASIHIRDKTGKKLLKEVKTPTISWENTKWKE